MEWVEITANTVDEATVRALDQLGVVEADAEIVVVEEPRTGLFGRVRGRGTGPRSHPPAGPRPKRSRRGRSGGRGAGRRVVERSPRAVGPPRNARNGRVRRAGATGGVRWFEVRGRDSRASGWLDARAGDRPPSQSRRRPSRHEKGKMRRWPKR